MNALQRMDNAMRRVEKASANLLASAHMLLPESAAWKQADLLACAREYANAMRALHRASRAKATP